MKKIFLGGTCNNSTWRDELIPKLKIDYFNPVVEDWTPECQENEIRERENSDYVLYAITPKMKGVYSIAEVVDDSNKRPEKTIFCILKNDNDEKFDESQIKSLNQVGKMVENNGGIWAKSLNDVADIVNDKTIKIKKYKDYIKK